MLRDGFLFHSRKGCALYTLFPYTSLFRSPGRDESPSRRARSGRPGCAAHASRSEEHTSELQSRLQLVCRLLRAKKNNAAVAFTQIRATSPNHAHTQADSETPR